MNEGGQLKVNFMLWLEKELSRDKIYPGLQKAIKEEKNEWSLIQLYHSPEMQDVKQNLTNRVPIADGYTRRFMVGDVLIRKEDRMRVFVQRYTTYKTAFFGQDINNKGYWFGDDRGWKKIARTFINLPGVLI